jgi:hypothetical protein
VLLELDLALRGKSRPQERAAHGLAQTGLGEKQEVVVAAPDDPKRRDDPPFRRQKQRVAGRLRDVVREHALEEVLGIRAADANVLALPLGNCHRN